MFLFFVPPPQVGGTKLFWSLKMQEENKNDSACHTAGPSSILTAFLDHFKITAVSMDQITDAVTSTLALRPRKLLCRTIIRCHLYNRYIQVTVRQQV